MDFVATHLSGKGKYHPLKVGLLVMNLWFDEITFISFNLILVFGNL